MTASFYLHSFVTLHKRNIIPSVVLLELKIGTSRTTVDSMTHRIQSTKLEDANKMVAFIVSERSIWVFFGKNIHMGSTCFKGMPGWPKLMTEFRI